MQVTVSTRIILLSLVLLIGAVPASAQEAPSADDLEPDALPEEAEEAADDAESLLTLETKQGRDDAGTEPEPTGSEPSGGDAEAGSSEPWSPLPDADLVQETGEAATALVTTLPETLPTGPLPLHPLSGQRGDEAATPTTPTGPGAAMTPADQTTKTTDSASAPVAAAAVIGVTGIALAAGIKSGSAATGTRLPWRRILMAVPLFTRFKRSTVLENKSREALYRLVQEEPGIHLQDLADKTGLGRSTVVHHIKLLQQHALVWSEQRGRTRHFFATTDGHAPADRDACVVLRNETTRKVAHYIDAHPGATQQELCQALGLCPSQVHDHTRRIHAAGLATKRRQGRFVAYHPTSVLPN